MSAVDSAVFKGTRALITGGMGFIGSSLAIALVDRGANVTIADAMVVNKSYPEFWADGGRVGWEITRSDAMS